MMWVKFDYQGHWVKAKVTFGKMRFLNCWIPNSFAVTVLWYEYGHQGQGHLKVKVIPKSNCKRFDFSLEVGSGPSIECILVCVYIAANNKKQMFALLIPKHYTYGERSHFP